MCLFKTLKSYLIENSCYAFYLELLQVTHMIGPWGIDRWGIDRVRFWSTKLKTG